MKVKLLGLVTVATLLAGCGSSLAQSGPPPVLPAETTTSTEYVTLEGFDADVAVATSVLCVTGNPCFQGTRVLVTAAVVAKNSTGALTSFALFRDGAQVSQDYTEASNPGLDFTVSFAFVDSPGAGSHSYDVRWKVAAGTATTESNERTIQTATF
jgi:hypothetical protein